MFRSPEEWFASRTGAAYDTRQAWDVGSAANVFASGAVPPQSPGSRAEPKLQHNFDGDSSILNGTQDSRAEVRKALIDLQKGVVKLEVRHVQVNAEIRILIDAPIPKEHTYIITITDSGRDLEWFSRQFAKQNDGGSFPSVSSGAPPTNSTWGQSGLGSDHADDVVGFRPPKHVRVDGPDRHLAADASTAQRFQNESLESLRQWHGEWVKQGGWLYDTIGKMEKSSRDDADHLASVQDVLGNSLNAVSASTMCELGNISKLIPWLEHCCKTAADNSQAREEKWRSISATFHDHSRRDREAAEQRIQDELQSQRSLLLKIAEANGVDIDDDSKHGTRDASLATQLTAELNMEASRAHERGEKPEQQNKPTISIDDD